MAVCPFAVWRPLKENSTEPYITATQVILHSAVSGADSLHGYFNRNDVTVESHFYVRWDGTIEQYIDTARQADANYKANARAISIETEDDGDPNNKPWSDAQLAALIRLTRWLCDTHGIPKTRVSGWDKPGIGYHSQYPGVWTPVKGKTCPGTVRIAQVGGIIEAVRGSAPAPTPTAAPAAGDEMDKIVARWGYLSNGKSGQGVLLWQGLLNGMGRKVGIDGVFGNETERATREWQAAAGVPGGADGIVGANTWGRALGTR